METCHNIIDVEYVPHKNTRGKWNLYSALVYPTTKRLNKAHFGVVIQATNGIRRKVVKRTKSAASTRTIECSELSEKVVELEVREDSGRMGGIMGWWNDIGRVLSA
jgi:hypothetical protein